MQAVTKDHSLVGRLIELGQITEEEAAVHPQRNVLYRALGQSEPFEPDLDIQTFPRPGHLMICSDGLWGVVPEEEMRRIIMNSPSLPDACQQLTAAANDAGGPDNITVILGSIPRLGGRYCMCDHYRTLGITKDATMDEIRDAFANCDTRVMVLI